jgi:diguanylate cyclase (GGDEF)-like protein/PAS domain S-box-containing protein
MGADELALGVDGVLAPVLAALPGVSVIIFDCEMRILEVHGTAIERHGYVPERMLGRRAPDVVPAAAWERLGPLYTRALTGETVAQELVSHDGKGLYETTFAPVRRDGVIVGGMAVASDITARRADLERSERDFRLLAESSTDLITRSAPDGAVFYVSPAVRTILGVEPEDYAGAMTWEHLHPDDLPRVIEVRREVLADGRPRSVAFRTRHADGRELWLESDIRAVRDEATGAIAEIHGSTRDVTRRRAHDELQRLWQLSFDTTTRGIAVKDPATSVIESVNPSFARMHGGTQADFEGRPLASILSAESAAQIAARAELIDRDGYIRYTSEHVRLDGTVFPVETEVVAARDADGRLLYRIGYHTDLSEQRAREASERQAVERFERSFNEGPVGMLLLRGRCIERANEAIAALVGVPADELVGRDPADFVHPVDAERARRSLGDLAEGRVASSQDRQIMRADGGVLHMRLRYSVLHDERDGRAPLVLVHLVDRTAEVLANETREAALALFETAFADAPIGLCLVGLDGRLLRVNRALCRLFERDEADLLTGDFQRVTHPEDLQKDLTLLRETLDGRRDGYELDKRYVTPGGATIDARLSVSLVRDAAGNPAHFVSQIVDLTARAERERALRELAAARGLFETAFANAPVGMLISRAEEDGTTSILQCNDAFAAMIGHTPAELVGRPGTLAVHPDDLPVRRRMLESVLAGRDASGELRLKHRDGRDIWTLVAPSTTLGPDGERLFVLQALDISERKRFEEQLRELADHDALTGLLSRRRFGQVLDLEVERVRRHGRGAAVLLLDLDGFKRVNDSFGHAAGDELLIAVSAALRGALRAADVVARIGGDEFAAILPETDAAGAVEVATKLVAAVRGAARSLPGGHGRDVTASVGVTVCTTKTRARAGELLAQADAAMYAAKRDGRDRVAVHPCADDVIT